MAFVLPFQHGALALLITALIAVGAAFRHGKLLLTVGQLLLALGKIVLRLFGAVGLLHQVALQFLHAGTRIGLFFFQLFDLCLQLFDLFLTGQLLLPGLVDQGVHVGQHVILVKAIDLAPESLLRRNRFSRRHGVPPLCFTADCVHKTRPCRKAGRARIF